MSVKKKNAAARSSMCVLWPWPTLKLASVHAYGMVHAVGIWACHSMVWNAFCIRPCIIQIRCDSRFKHPLRPHPCPPQTTKGKLVYACDFRWSIASPLQTPMVSHTPWLVQHMAQGSFGRWARNSLASSTEAALSTSLSVCGLKYFSRFLPFSIYLTL